MSAVRGLGGHLGLYAQAEAYDYFGWTLYFMIFLIFVEALYSYFSELDYYALNDSIVSMSHGVLSDFVVQKVFIPNLELLVQCWIYYHYAIYRLKPTWWLHVITFFGIDLCYYWLHRAAHEVNFIWATHQVHHSSERYNLTTATRQGVFQQFVAWLAYVPLAFFVPPTTFMVHRQINTLYQFWIHTRVVGKMGSVLEFVLNTPSHHRVHHARNPKYLDKNYGGLLIIWDRMFGTFEAESETVSYGLVHPDTFYNVFTAQFGHYYHIVHSYVTKRDSIGDRLKTVFYGPGWVPGSPRMGFPIEDTPEEAANRRGDSPAPTFNPVINSSLRKYLLGHSVVTFGLIFITSSALTPKSNLEFSLAIFNIFSLFQISRIFQDGYASFLPFEAFRVILFVAVQVSCLVHDVMMDRTPGLWWSAAYDLARFSPADYVFLIFVCLVFVFSIWFILYYWDEIWNECSHTRGPPPNLSIRNLARALSPKPSRKGRSPRLHIADNNAVGLGTDLPLARNSPRANGNVSPRLANGASSRSTSPRVANGNGSTSPRTNGAARPASPRVAPATVANGSTPRAPAKATAVIDIEEPVAKRTAGVYANGRAENGNAVKNTSAKQTGGPKSPRGRR